MTTREFWNLTAVSDERLLQDLGGLLAGGARVEARIVAHLAEVEERRLHLKAATSSLFDYCLRRLGLSESEAFHRITAARLARRFSLVFELLEARAIHLSALRVLRDHLTPENHRELLALACNKSKKAVEALVATIAPRPDVPARIRKLPAQRCPAQASPIAASVNAVPITTEPGAEKSIAAMPFSEVRVKSPGSSAVMEEVRAPVASGEGEARFPSYTTAFMAAVPFGSASEVGAVSSTLLTHPDEAQTAALSERAGVQASPSRCATATVTLSPLSSTRHLLRATISHELKDKLERARDLLSHANPSGELTVVLERALDLLLEKLEAQRFARTRGPRPARKSPIESVPRGTNGWTRKARETTQTRGGHGAARAPVQAREPSSVDRCGRLETLSEPRSEIAPQPAPEQVREPSSVDRHGGLETLSEPKSERARESEKVIARQGARREHIPNEIRRAVASRDGWQCTYRDGEGNRCASRAFLQLHHEHAHALGGPSTIENLRLLCASHNRLLAERDFGRAHQEHFARKVRAANGQVGRFRI